MNCINCGSKELNTFFTETLPCSHCDEINEIAYHACEVCGMVWRSIGNKISDDIMFYGPDLASFLSELPTPENINNNSMQEIIHRCLRCNTVSFEIGTKLYHCPDCSFEWEVI